MFVQPDDLTDDAVRKTLSQGWGIVADEITYATLGFGSHHWNVVVDDTRLFVTVDDLDARLRHAGETRASARQRLASALSTARTLQQAGRPFVVGPASSHRGSVLENVDDRYVLAVYPHVDGRSGSYGPYGTQAERFAVIDRLIDLHEATEVVTTVAGIDDFSIPSRDRLSIALADVSSPWATGPYAERTRALLDRHAVALTEVLTRYDDLVTMVQQCGDDAVVTHGEPHRGNVIFTTDGPSLIDWDTTLLAPQERDLWSLIDEDPETADYYKAQSGRSLNDDALQLYRLWWDLCEVSLFVTEFRNPHIDSADTLTAWEGLEKHLDPIRWVEAT